MKENYKSLKMLKHSYDDECGQCSQDLGKIPLTIITLIKEKNWMIQFRGDQTWITYARLILSAPSPRKLKYCKA